MDPSEFGLGFTFAVALFERSSGDATTDGADYRMLNIALWHSVGVGCGQGEALRAYAIELSKIARFRRPDRET